MTLNNENNTDYLKIAQRPNFFAGQYLLEDDFEDLHNYHDAQQRLHHRFLHVSGIIEGLVVTVAGQRKVKVSAGTAIDPQGNVIVLKADREVDLSNAANTVDLSLTFKENPIKLQEEQNKSTFTRYEADPEIALGQSTPKSSVTLATLTISGNTVTPDLSKRQMSGVLLPSPGGRLSLRYQGNHQTPGENALETALLAGHLSVKGDLSVTGNSMLTGSLTVSSPVYLKGSSNTTGLNVDASGSVGVGTTTPSTKLQVEEGALSVTNKDSSNNTWGLQIEAGSQPNASKMGVSQIKAIANGSGTGIQNIEILPKGTGAGQQYQAGQVIIGKNEINRRANLTVNGRISTNELRVDVPTLQFINSRDNVNFGMPDKLNPTGYEWTVELWFRYDRTDTKGTKLYKKVPSYEVFLRNQGLYFSPTKQREERSANFPVIPGQWYHAAIVFDRTSNRVYCNGTLTCTYADSDEQAMRVKSSTDKLELGGYHDANEYFQGSIRDFRIWSVARSADEIRNNMNSTLQGDESGLVGYWPLDEGQGSTVYDKTANPANGTITGAQWVQQRVVNIKSNGNVGIGTITPSEALEIQRAGNSNFLSIYNSGTEANQESRIIWKNGVNRTNTAAIASRPGTNLNAGDLRFQTASNSNLQERMIINSVGNVGIGINAPVAKLAINGGLHVGGDSDPGDDNLLVDGTLAVTGNSTLTGSLTVNNTVSLKGSASAIGLTVNATGNVGIGTTTPSTKLQVEGGALLVTNKDSSNNWGLQIEAGSQPDASSKIGVSRIKATATGAGTKIQNIELLPKGTGTGLQYQTGQVIVGKNEVDGKADLNVNGKIVANELHVDVSILQFSNRGEKVNIPHADHLKPKGNTWTVELWFKCDNASIGVETTLYCKNNTYWAKVTDGKFEYAFYPYWGFSGSEKFSVVSGQWYHAAVVYDGSSQKLYRNGAQVFERVQRGSMTPPNNEDLYLFPDMFEPEDNRSSVQGSIREFRIWSVARSADEIRNNMYSTLQGNEQGLVGYWPLDEGKGNTAYDKTANSANGTITGAKWVQKRCIDIKSSLNGKADLGIFGDIKVNGQVYIDNTSSIKDSIIRINVTAEAFLDNGNNVLVSNNPPTCKIGGRSIEFNDPSIGLNTIIFNPSLNKKTGRRFDPYNSEVAWSNWADWINNNAADGDVIITASMDALKNAPSTNGNSATVLLKSINSQKAFQLENTTLQSLYRNRSAYVLIFAKGQNRCIEALAQARALTPPPKTQVLVSLNTSVIAELLKEPKDSFNTLIKSEENGLRLLRGSIYRDGSIVAGAGFYILKEEGSQGQYTIRFVHEFSSLPTVVATQRYAHDTNNWGSDTRDNCVVTYITKSECRIICGNNGGTKADRDFEFIAVGY